MKISEIIFYLQVYCDNNKERLVNSIEFTGSNYKLIIPIDEIEKIGLSEDYIENEIILKVK